MKRLVSIASVTAMCAIPNAAFAQVGPAGPPGISPEVLQRMQADEAAARAQPDNAGRGAYPAQKSEDRLLSDHTIYRPVDLAKVKRRLPIVVWAMAAALVMVRGNGCICSSSPRTAIS